LHSVQETAFGRGRESPGCSSRAIASFVPFFDEAELSPGVKRPSPVVVEAIVGGIAQLLFGYVATGRTQEVPDLAPEIAYFTLLPFLGSVEAAKELRR